MTALVVGIHIGMACIIFCALPGLAIVTGASVLLTIAHSYCDYKKQCSDSLSCVCGVCVGVCVCVCVCVCSFFCQKGSPGDWSLSAGQSVSQRDAAAKEASIRAADAIELATQVNIISADPQRLTQRRLFFLYRQLIK